MTVTTSEAADLLGIPAGTVRRWASQGWIERTGYRYGTRQRPEPEYDWKQVAQLHAKLRARRP